MAYSNQGMQKPMNNFSLGSMNKPQVPNLMGDMNFGRPNQSIPATGQWAQPGSGFAMGGELNMGPGGNNPAMPGGMPGTEGGSIFDSFLQQRNPDGSTGGGWGGAALQIGEGLVGGYLGMKQYGMAKKQLEESKRQFQLNYENQKKLTNAELRDRQRRRHNDNPEFAESADEYMKKNGI